MYNTPETDYDHDYFSSYPYAVEIFKDDTCTDIYRSNELTNAQAKFDSWTQDLQGQQGIEVKMLKYNIDSECHDLIDYNGNIIE